MKLPVSIMALLFFTAPAMAQQICAKRDGVLEYIEQKFAETPRALGITGSGQVVELLTSDDGSWTLIATRPNGVSCMMAAGEGWETVERVAEGPGA